MWRWFGGFGLLLWLAGGSSLTAGSIIGSKHDLSAVWTGGSTLMRYSFNNYGEACVYCHTPHFATPATDAPLWNREMPVGPYGIYSSTSIDTSIGQPSGVSLACLSCHDGTVAVDAVLNAPGSGANLGGPWYGQTASPFHFKMAPGVNNCGECHSASGVGHDASGAYLGTDLSKDHPISMAYPTAAEDADFLQPIGAPGAPRYFPNGVRTFDGDKVECATCHNVHDPAFVPFLRVHNGNSALCVTCHLK